MIKDSNLKSIVYRSNLCAQDKKFNCWEPTNRDIDDQPKWWSTPCWISPIRGKQWSELEESNFNIFRANHYLRFQVVLAWPRAECLWYTFHSIIMKCDWLPCWHGIFNTLLNFYRDIVPQALGKWQATTDRIAPQVPEVVRYRQIVPNAGAKYLLVLKP